jgi:hypothetical protein
MKTRDGGGIESQFYTFFNLGAIRGDWSRPRPGSFTPWGVVHFVGEWVEPRAGVEICGKSRPNRDSIVGPSGLPVVPVRIICT